MVWRKRKAHLQSNSLRDEEEVVIFSATVWETVEKFMLDQLCVLQTEQDIHVVVSGVPRRGLEMVSNVKLHELKMVRGISPGQDFVSLVRWLEIIGRFSPRLVVASTPKAGLLSLLAAAFWRVPRRVYWLHGLPYETHKGFTRRLLMLVEALSLRLATEVLPVSQSISDVVRKDFPVPSAKVIKPDAWHANGLDLSVFCAPTPEQRRNARQRFKLPVDAVIVGFLGRYARDKGLLDLVSAMSIIAEKNLEVIAVFGGTRDARDGVDVNLLPGFQEGNCRDLGPQEYPLHFYWTLDVFCMPSHREGLSTVNLEAAACGLPVVTTLATGCYDSIVPGTTGATVSPSDPVGLAAELGRFVEDKDLRKTMGQAGRSWVVENFGRDRIWKSNLAIFEGFRQHV